MIKKTITYTDYNNEERTEDFYFNLTKAELLELETSATGGMTQLLNRIVAEKDQTQIVKIFKEVLLMAYGEKSPDGRRFVKSKELSEAFSHTEAYSDLFTELATDSDAATAFINGILPSK